VPPTLIETESIAAESDDVIALNEADKEDELAAAPSEELMLGDDAEVEDAVANADEVEDRVAAFIAKFASSIAVMPFKGKFGQNLKPILISNLKGPSILNFTLFSRNTQEAVASCLVRYSNAV
jgi:hypothetical protein